jgi:hypothetical protein
MDKDLSKTLFRSAGVTTADWLMAPATEDQVESVMGWPVIVKPCNLGSSAGVSTAASPADLVAGVLRVFEYDVEALIEPFIKNRLEVNVAVAGLDVPVAGSVAFDGEQLPRDEPALREYRRTVGTVFQAYNLFPHLTALENLLLPLMHVHGLTDLESRSGYATTEHGGHISVTEALKLAAEAKVIPVRFSDSGGILCVLRGREGLQVLSQVRDSEGRPAWLRATGVAPVDQPAADAYVERQVKRDPDLWVVEFDAPDLQPPFEARVV